MKVCIYGTGAVGGALGGHDYKGGAEVSAVARGAILEAIRARGLIVRTTVEEIRGRLKPATTRRRSGPRTR